MRSSLAIDQLINQLARKYDGLVPTKPLYDAGHCRSALVNRNRIDTLAPVMPGVRRLGSVELSPVRLAMAAALVLPDSWISHTSALTVHGAIMRDKAIFSEVSSPHQHRRAGLRIHRLSLPSDLGKHFELPISRPWRAIVESAAVLEEDDLAVAMDSLVQKGLISVNRVQRAATDAGWFRGQMTLQRLLNDRINGEGLVRSFLEQDLSRLLRRNKLPTPVRNYRMVLPDGKVRILDTAWPDLHIGLEAHSWKHHSNTTDWGNTITRDRRLTVFGWTILPVVVSDIRNPATLMEELSELFTRVRYNSRI
jgi:hypothetical protein